MKFKWKGKKWTIQTVDHLPDNDHGRVLWEERLLLIRSKDRGKELLGTRIHELTHVACPWMDESAVAELEVLLRDCLWKMGYRCPEDDDDQLKELLSEVDRRKSDLCDTLTVRTPEYLVPETD